MMPRQVSSPPSWPGGSFMWPVVEVAPRGRSRERQAGSSSMWPAAKRMSRGRSRKRCQREDSSQ
eukprot:4900388-Lingulodinium_polyedra.AAC.1